MVNLVENISKRDFWELMKPELAYYNKKWKGVTEEEKKKNEKDVLLMYYKSLCFATKVSFEIALNHHRQSESTFPKIPDLIRRIPKPIETHQTPTYKKEPMPDNVLEIVNRKSKPNCEMKLKMANMINERYNTPFVECKQIVGLEFD